MFLADPEGRCSEWTHTREGTRTKNAPLPSYRDRAEIPPAIRHQLFYYRPRPSRAHNLTISTTTASILAILGGVFLLMMAALGHSFGRHGASSGIAFILVGLFRIGKSFFGASD